MIWRYAAHMQRRRVYMRRFSLAMVRRKVENGRIRAAVYDMGGP